MIKALRLIRKFGKPALPFILEMLEALLDGDIERFKRAGHEAARKAGVKTAAREYLG